MMYERRLCGPEIDLKDNPAKYELSKFNSRGNLQKTLDVAVFPLIAPIILGKAAISFGVAKRDMGWDVPGIQTQYRVGKNSVPIVKLKTTTLLPEAVRLNPGVNGNTDSRVGSARLQAIRDDGDDEGWEVINIARGESSFVGPRASLFEAYMQNIQALERGVSEGSVHPDVPLVYEDLKSAVLPGLSDYAQLFRKQFVVQDDALLRESCRLEMMSAMYGSARYYLGVLANTYPGIAYAKENRQEFYAGEQLSAAEEVESIITVEAPELLDLRKLQV